MTDSHLPDGWVRVRLDEVAEVRLGRQRSPKNHTGDQMRPYLRAANVTWRGLELSDVNEMNFTDAEVDTYRLRDGDVLLSEASGSPGEVGKPAVWRSQLPGNVCFQNTLLRVRPEAGVESDYLHFRLLHECRRGGFASSSRGVGIHHLGAANLAALEIELPGSRQQRRIADVLDVLLSSVGRTVDALNGLRRRLDLLEQSVLEHTARGTLLEPERCLENGPLPVTAAGRPPKKFTYAALPALPTGWRWVPAVDACDSVECGGTPEASAMRPGTGDIPFLKVYNLRKDGGVDFTVRPTFIDDVTHRNRLKRSIARPGDVLINIVGPPMGKVGIVPATYPEWNYNQAIVAMRPSANVQSRFLALILRSRFVLDRLVATSKATAGQFNISLSACRELPVPVPPVAEQDLLVVEAEALLSRVDAARARLDHMGIQLDALARAGLTAAFTGELVAQDPLDEPAVLLLKQIGEARAAAGTAAGRGRKGTVRPPRRARVSQEETA